MNCRTFREEYIMLLDTQPGPMAGELMRHINECPECAAHFAEIRKTTELLSPSCPVQPSQSIEENVMSRILEMDRVITTREPKTMHLWRPLLAASLIGLIVFAAIAVLNRGGSGANHNSRLSAITLISQAQAAEEQVFAGKGIIHIVNRIQVGPVANPDLAKLLWLPQVILEENGKTNFCRLALPADTKKSYAIDDEIWFEQATARYIRVMTGPDGTVFATAFDGKAVFFFNAGDAGVSRKPITHDFKPPLNPVDFLGITAGLPANMKDETVQNAGTETLEDGSEVRVFKWTMPQPDGVNTNTFWLYKIRTSDNTVSAKEWYLAGARAIAIERIKSESIGTAPAWDLAGTIHPPKTAIKSVMDTGAVVPDASVEDMVRRASFETYVLSESPAWAPKRSITDIGDPVTGFTQRMFLIVYLAASDHRHVVLVQSPSYNKMLGDVVKKGKMIYQSPNGFKVFSGQRDKWLAGILLDSSRAVTREKTTSERSGYILQSPAGTYPALAVNGTLTEAELHHLIDSLVPAKTNTK